MSAQPSKLDKEAGSLKIKTPIIVVHAINDPAATGKTNESGSNLSIIRYITAPTPYSIKPTKNVNDIQLCVAFISPRPLQLIKMYARKKLAR